MTSTTAILADIRERVIKIETHLGDMNGRLTKHDTFLAEDCPNRHQEIQDALSKNSVYLKISSWVGGAILIILIGYVFEMILRR